MAARNLTSSRWLVGPLIMVAGPYGVAVLWLIVLHRFPALTRNAAFGWVVFPVAWAIGLLGVHCLPVSQTGRAIVAVIYTPLACFLVFVTLLSIGCAWYAACF